MKYVIILCDGMADEPIAQLNGNTPLGAARTPNMDRLAQTAQLGRVRTVPEDMSPGSDTANLSVIGYDPKRYYTGRSPLEALSIGVDMKPTDVTYRCNLVTLSEDEPYEKKVILDHSAGEISPAEAAVLMDAVRETLTEDGYTFYTGTSYRHLLVETNGSVRAMTAPHDILTQCIGRYLPLDEPFLRMMKRSYDVLNTHPINSARREAGKNTANSIWFWGGGTRPQLSDFYEKNHKKGAMISAVDLLKGIAVGAGMTNIHVEGATGGLDTDYEGKAKAAVTALTEDGFDFVYVHIEAPDEMGHQGNLKHKIEAIERIDRYVVGPLEEKLRSCGEDVRILILPDHPTPVRLRTHTKDPVPFLLYDSRDREAADTREQKREFSEKSCEESGELLEEGYRLIDRLFQEDPSC